MRISKILMVEKQKQKQWVVSFFETKSPYVSNRSSFPLMIHDIDRYVCSAYCLFFNLPYQGRGIWVILTSVIVVILSFLFKNQMWCWRDCLSGFVWCSSLSHDNDKNWCIIGQEVSLNTYVLKGDFKINLTLAWV